MWDLCDDISRRIPQLSHVDMRKVAVSFSQTRNRSLHGYLAKLTPLRFEGGSLVTRRRGRTWTVQRVFDQQGQEKFYILSFYLPRFLEQPLSEKLTTVFHELWHIGPSFDGDLRRFPGRCYAHSSSQKDFDALAAALAKHWLARTPPAPLYDFLDHSFDQLRRRHGAIHGLKLKIPKLVPVKSPV